MCIYCSNLCAVTGYIDFRGYKRNLSSYNCVKELHQWQLICYSTAGRLQGLQGSLLCCEAVTGYIMGNRHYSQMKNKVMSKFYKLQGLRGSLLYVYLLYV